MIFARVRSGRFRFARALCAPVVGLLLGALTVGNASGGPQLPASTGPTPRLRVEYFEAERGYTVRQDDVILLCVVRNVGGVALPEKTLRLHCLPMSGLDYTSGDTLPPVPALAPDQSAAFRWRFSATEAGAASIAAVLVEPIGGTAGSDTTAPAGDVALTVIPRLDAPLRFGAPIAGVDFAPQAGFAGHEAWLGSNRVALRFVASRRGEPLLLLAARMRTAGRSPNLVNSGADWQTTAIGLPLARALTAEDGQSPWWQDFRWRQTRARADKETATLTLMGTIGDCWRAELEFTARRDTGALDGRLRLTARRNVRCQAVQLPRLLLGNPEHEAAHADGTSVLLPALDPSLPAEASVAAVRTGSGTTCGLTWPVAAPLAGWSWDHLPIGDPDSTRALGVRCVGAAPGDLTLAGGSVEFIFRLFALTPSDTIRDALRFALP